MYRYKKCHHCDESGKEIDHARTGQNLRELREAEKVSLRKLAKEMKNFSNLSF